LPSVAAEPDQVDLAGRSEVLFRVGGAVFQQTDDQILIEECAIAALRGR
jgi:hypothetical protein